MNASALFAIGCWLALVGGIAYALGFRDWYRRQCRYEQLRQDFGTAARMSDIIDAEAPTEDIEEALLLANGLAAQLEEIRDLPEWWPGPQLPPPTSAL